MKKCALTSFFALLILAAAAARPEKTVLHTAPLGGGESTQLVNSKRGLKSESQEAFELAQELTDEISQLEERPAEAASKPMIDQHCVVYTHPFFKAKGGSFAGCFLSCTFIDYCDLLTYSTEHATCSFYHHPEVEWTDDGPNYCWGYDVAEPAPSSEEAPASEEANS